MPRTPAAEGAPAHVPTPADPVAKTGAELKAAQAARVAANGKVAQLRAREAEIAGQIVQQRALVLGAGDAMAANPGSETEEAFEAATAQLTNLEAQEAALRDRLIPAAETVAGQAADAVAAARHVHHQALFRARVQADLIPADRRWEAALAELAAAYEGCKAIRAELSAEPAFGPFIYRTIGLATPQYLLGPGLLGLAVPFELSRYFYAFAQAPSSRTAQTLPVDLARHHARAFGLETSA